MHDGGRRAFWYDSAQRDTRFALVKICLVAHGFPPDLLGGTEVTTHALAHALVDAGHDVVVVAGSDRWRGGFGVRSERIGERLVVHRVQRDDPHFGHWQKLTSPRAGAAYEALLRSERPDVVHVHHWLRLSSDLVRRAARVGVPSIVTLHDHVTSCIVHHRVRPDTLAFCTIAQSPDPCVGCANRVYLETPWVTPAAADERFVRERARISADVRAARCVIALSSELAALSTRVLALEHTPEVVAPISVSSLRARTRATPSRTDTALVAATWGSLSRLKGVDVVIAALRLARERGVDVELEVAGREDDAAHREHLTDLARDLPVHFRGPYDAIEHSPVANADLFVSGSRAHETWSVVVDEALRLGLPVVVPRSGAFVDRFTHGHGAFLYEPGSEAALADVFTELARDRARLATAALHVEALAARLPSAADVVARHLALYRAAIAAGAPPVTLDDDDEAEEVRWHADWDAHFRRVHTPAADSPNP